MRWTLSGLALVAALAVAPAAHARPTVAVTKVDVTPERSDAPRLAREVKQLLGEAARRANFGKGSAKTRIELSAHLTEFSAETHGDVLKIHCAMSGKVLGSRGAKSRISYGGNVADRAKLEHEVLRMVSNGLVARLAQIARAAREDE